MHLPASTGLASVVRLPVASERAGRVTALPPEPSKRASAEKGLEN